MSKIQVKEINVPIYHLVKSFDINIIILDLTKSVDLTARCYDKDGIFLYQKSFSIVGEEYSNWSSDDDYLINLVASKLGLEVEPTIELIVEPIPTQQSEPIPTQQPEPIPTQQPEPIPTQPEIVEEPIVNPTFTEPII